MRRVSTFSFAILTLSLLSGRLSAQSIAEKAQSAMHRVFGSCEKITSVTVPIDSNVTNKVYALTGQVVRGRAVVQKALDSKGVSVGFGIVDEVRGKAQAITYMALLKPDASLADIEVLVYREPYGGEVAYESFRKQFRGKRAQSDLHIGKDIQNIAGATISSKAVTAGAKKLVVLFDELRKAGKL